MNTRRSDARSAALPWVVLTLMLAWPVSVCEDLPLPEPRLIVEFDSPSLILYPGISVSSDSIYISVGTYQSDIWVMDLVW